MKIEIKARTETTDGVVHHVFHESKHVGFVIKTENKEKPYTLVDMQGDFCNTENLEDAVRKVCLKQIALNLPKNERADFLLALFAMKMRGML
ncbi:hypothetical protein [Enterobacter ludwigii]|uniref:hypothetical protein n=1 Tax=Enterobacter ludwigii TaxID=299767 RepID=UPI002A81BD73|nr:hypothetical protein [Enterobacter ludwigii]